MTKKERAALVGLYTEALRINRHASPDRDRENRGFGRGYEWGINQAMKAVGFTWNELWQLWDQVQGEPEKGAPQ